MSFKHTKSVSFNLYIMYGERGAIVYINGSESNMEYKGVGGAELIYTVCVYYTHI